MIRDANRTTKLSDSIFKGAVLNSELSHLISLQDIDVEIKRLTEEIESLPARRDGLERQFAESVKEYLAIKQELEDALGPGRHNQ